MKFTKPALSYDDQASLLLARGMRGDAATMRECLSTVGYYRLSGYWFPYRQADDSFRPGTTFGVVWDRYVFDRKLRLLVMDAIERIEIAVRAALAYEHALIHGAFGYAEDPTTLPKLSVSQHTDLVSRIREEVHRSRKETFVAHFNAKYGDPHPDLPIWVVTEVMSFGTIQKVFAASPKPIKTKVARRFAVTDVVFESWLQALNVVRNICAHHSRLWNRTLGVKPMIPHESRSPEWHRPVPIRNDRVFGILTIVAHCLACVASGSTWAKRVREHYQEHPAIPLRDMGAPANWIESPVWKGVLHAA